jgi:hypothetical protein
MQDARSSIERHVKYSSREGRSVWSTSLTTPPESNSTGAGTDPSAGVISCSELIASIATYLISPRSAIIEFRIIKKVLSKRENQAQHDAVFVLSSLRPHSGAPVGFGTDGRAITA